MAQIVFYCQHLTGIGHYVRSREIVRALALRHDVTFVVGGRPVPGDIGLEPFKIVQLPPIFRGASGVASVDEGRALDLVLEERRARLKHAVEVLRADLFIVEHFPFSKWALGAEILPAIDRARSVNPRVDVVCSLRDIALTSRFDLSMDFEPEVVAHRIRDTDDVVDVLNRSFDAVLVHGDPTVTRLSEQIDWASDIAVPIVYTGYVSETLDRDSWPDRGDLPTRPFVLVSAGGGAEALEVAAPCIEAWHICRDRGWSGDRELVIITGPYVDPDGFRRLELMTDVATIRLYKSAERLLPWMDAADLSISRAGYNTCTNILASGSRAIVLPSPVMSDQLLRARRLSERGLLSVIEPDSVTPAEIAQTIRDTLSKRPPGHEVDLGGAAATLAYVDALDGGTV